MKRNQFARFECDSYCFISFLIHPSNTSDPSHLIVSFLQCHIDEKEKTKVRFVSFSLLYPSIITQIVEGFFSPFIIQILIYLQLNLTDRQYYFIALIFIGALKVLPLSSSYCFLLNLWNNIDRQNCIDLSGSFRIFLSKRKECCSFVP